MASCAVGRPIAAPIVRFMIGTNRVVRANPQSFQCVFENMRKPWSRRDEASERTLCTSARSIDKYPATIDLTDAPHA